ncbi:MAG: hypothetical protein V9G14_11235 [Cypionkella sp.]
MLDYGVLVFRGDGVKQDEKIGAQWLLLSARRGNVIAQNRVARLLAFGTGLAADPVEAQKWNLLAARAGRAGRRTRLPAGAAHREQSRPRPAPAPMPSRPRSTVTDARDHLAAQSCPSS